MDDEEIVRRLAAGEDPWVIDPDHGCTNPLTGYFPQREVDAYLEAQAPTEPPLLLQFAPEGDGSVTEYVRGDVVEAVRAALEWTLDVSRLKTGSTAVQRARELLGQVDAERQALGE